MPKKIRRSHQANDRAKITDPVAAARRLRDKVKKLEGGYRRRLHASLIEAYAIGLAFSENAKGWRGFIADSFWNELEVSDRPTKEDRGAPLKFVLRYAFDAKTLQGYNRVAKYHRAFEAWFRKKRSAAAVRTKLKKVGIEAMYDIAKEFDPKHKKAAVPVDNPGPDASPDPGPDASPPSTEIGAGANSEDGLGKKVKRGRIKKALTLFIEVVPRQLEKALGIAVGEQAAVTYERVEDDGDWVRLVATEIRLISKADEASDEEG